MLKLSIYRLRYLAIEVYRCVHKNNPNYLNDMFERKSATYDFRNEDRLIQPTYTTRTFGYRSFAYYGAKIWNTLPNVIKQAPTIKEFKVELDKWCRSSAAHNLEVF